MIATENLKGKSGVYCAIHRDTLKCYVGSSVNLERRRLNHLSEAKKPIKSRFQRRLSELGPESFDFEVVEFCPRESLAERETFWIKFYQSASGGNFNFLSTAQPAAFAEEICEQLRIASRNMSQETRQKIGRAVSARIVTDETRAKLSDSVKNRPPVSNETRAKISEANRNRSEETHRRMSAAQKCKPPMSEETKKKISAYNLARPPRTKESLLKLSASQMGHPVSEETRAKLRAANLGKVQPKEVGEKIAAANLGRKHTAKALENMRKSKSPEWRRKVSETMKRICAERKAIKEQSR